MKTCGIYSICLNNEYYIGSSYYIEQRYRSHLLALKKNKHHSIYLQRVYNKYNGEGISLNIILVVDDKNDLVKIEQYYINLLKPLYNMSPTAGSPLGTKHTEQSKQNMSNAHKGIKWSEHQMKLEVERMKLFRHTEESKNKMKESWKNRKPVSEEARRKMSESAKKRPPQSEETKRKRAEKITGLKRSEETKLKQSLAMIGKCKGRKSSDFQKSQVSKANLGIRKSEQTRMKMSIAQNKRRTEERNKQNDNTTVVNYD